MRYEFTRSVVLIFEIHITHPTGNKQKKKKDPSYAPLLRAPAEFFQHDIFLFIRIITYTFMRVPIRHFVKLILSDRSKYIQKKKKTPDSVLRQTRYNVRVLIIYYVLGKVQNVRI